MKGQVSLLSWPAGVPAGVKRTVIAYEEGVDLLSALRCYADSHGYTLLDERPDGLVSLYWNESQRLVRMAIEPVE